MKVAVAGGTGFVGRHVVEALRARGHSVIVLARGRHGVPLGAELVACDLARESVPPGTLRGTDALVNLAGIKREDRTQTFEAVHVEATRRLLAACEADGVRRFVHLSVVCSRPDPHLPYHDTKWQAEEAVRASGLDFTILKPAVIYGPGDDMVTHLVRMIRFAPLFPVVGRGESILMPVDVRDVAEAVAAALDRPRSIGGTYDVVGPDRLPLAEVVGVVADGIGLRVHIVPTPLAVQRAAVRVMDAVTTQPLSTPAQLQMLVDGLYGDTKPARRDLGLVPRPFTADSVRAIEGAIGPLFGMSLRVADRRGHAEWLARYRPALVPAVALAVLALLVQTVLALTVPNVWSRMAASGLVLSAFALARVRLDWRALYRPSWRHFAPGAVAAAVMYAVGAFVTRLLTASPALAAQIVELLRMEAHGAGCLGRSAAPDHRAGRRDRLAQCGDLAAGRAVGTVARGGGGRRPVRARAPPDGVPFLLLAAMGAGTFWSAFVLKTRSAVPALVITCSSTSPCCSGFPTCAREPRARRASGRPGPARAGRREHGDPGRAAMARGDGGAAPVAPTALLDLCRLHPRLPCRVRTPVAPRPGWLLDGTGLAASVSGFIALYWSARLVLQFTYLDRSDAPQGRWFLAAEAALVSLFVFLSVTYTGALVANLAR
jgi:NADH dehydrogenase